MLQDFVKAVPQLQRASAVSRHIDSPRVAYGLAASFGGRHASHQHDQSYPLATTLAEPTLPETCATRQNLLPSIQVNIRAGAFPPAEDNGVRYLRIPVTFKADRKAKALPACFA